jgi:hypothetical protein
MSKIEQSLVGCYTGSTDFAQQDGVSRENPGASVAVSDLPSKDQGLATKMDTNADGNVSLFEVDIWMSDHACHRRTAIAIRNFLNPEAAAADKAEGRKNFDDALADLGAMSL